MADVEGSAPRGGLTLKGGVSLKCVSGSGSGRGQPWTAMLRGPGGARCARDGRDLCRKLREEKKKKKHSRRKEEKQAKKERRERGKRQRKPEEGEEASGAAEQEPPPPERRVGTGRISTSGITVAGKEGTRFQTELDPGDALIVNHPTRCGHSGAPPQRGGEAGYIYSVVGEWRRVGTAVRRKGRCSALTP